MRNILPFVVIGLTTGSVYALAATGLVLTYKTSRIFNFAHGSFASVVVLLFFALVYRAGLDWRLAAALAVVAIGPLLGGAFEQLGRRLGPLGTEAKVLATIGLVLAISGGVALWGAFAFSPRAANSQPHLPSSLVRILGVNIGVDQLIIMAVGLVATGLLHLFLEHGPLGRSMRAVVDNGELLAMTGRNPSTVLRASWALGIGFVGLSGLLLVLSPSYTVSVATLFALVLQCFGAAAIGGFSSLPLTYAGGLVIGLLSAISTYYLTSVSWLRGLPPSIPFVVLFLALLLWPRHLAVESTTRVVPSARRTLAVSRRFKAPLWALAAAAIALVPISRSVHLVYTGNLALGYATILLGLGLLVRTSGQVSLCQLGLAAFGATIFAKLAVGAGLPWLAALLVGGLAAAGLGVVVAIPAIRVAGIYLALATYGFAVLLEQLVYPTRLMFLPTDASAPRPALGAVNGGDDITFFFVCLAIYLVSLFLVTGARRARLGRLLRALADSPVVLTAQGCSVNATRIVVFAMSAFLAGVGGVLIVSQERFLVATPFSSSSSLLIFVALLTIRTPEPASSLLAAAALAVVPSFLTGQAQVWWLDIGFGLAAVLVAVGSAHAALPKLAWRTRDRAQDRAAVLPPAPGGTDEAPARTARGAVTRRPTPSGSGLEVRDLTVRFRGLVAVDGLDLRAGYGEITGLIGPNGAGKTTTFNFCSGFVPAVHGHLLLDGRDITRLSPAARARHGLGRTFQTPSLFESMTVWENVAMGREAGMAGRHVIGQIVASRAQKRLAEAAAADALQAVGIGSIARRRVVSLSTGEKRLVELARCLAGPYRILLLDEPSSGLDEEETRRFGDTLRRATHERGLGVLLVEHNVSLVTSVCASLYVLDFGRLIYAGPPEAMTANDAVRRAYLGASVS